MAGPIQTSAAGFLALLQLKNLGGNPPNLGETVAPTLDMLTWYLMDGEQRGLGATTAGGYETIQLAVVPARELWFVHSLTGSIEVAAADNYVQANLALITVNGASLDGPTIQLAAAPAATFLSPPSLRDFWARPGDSLRIRVRSPAIGRAVQIAAFYTRITPYP